MVIEYPTLFNTRNRRTIQRPSRSFGSGQSETHADRDIVRSARNAVDQPVDSRAVMDADVGFEAGIRRRSKGDFRHQEVQKVGAGMIAGIEFLPVGHSRSITRAQQTKSNIGVDEVVPRQPPPAHLGMRSISHSLLWPNRLAPPNSSSRSSGMLEKR